MAATLGDLVVSTARNWSKEAADNITNHNALLKTLKSKGHIKKASGGRTLVETLMIGDNSSVQFYTGYDTFTPPTTGQNVLDGAEFDWKQLGGFIGFSRLEEKQNAGPEQRIDLAMARIKQLKLVLENTAGLSMFSDGTGSGGKEFGGLQLIIDDDPTSAGTVGGIDQAANSYWRNYTSGSQTLDKDTIVGALNTAWFSLVRGGDKPDLIVADDIMFGYYETKQQELGRFLHREKADAGFAGYAYKSADILYDANCPAKRMYLLNTDYLHFQASSKKLLEVGDKRQVTNAAYEVIPVWMDGNFTCSNRARQGVIIDD